MADIVDNTLLYPIDLASAELIQEKLARAVVIEDEIEKIEYLVGVDVSNNIQDPKQLVYGAAVQLDPNSLTIISSACAAQQQKFPYIPRFLSFREIPVLLEALQKLTVVLSPTTLIMVDGHGISHPRGLGIASHLGVLLNCPTIGVAKSILVGKPAGELGEQVGARVPLIWKEKQLGMLVRTKRNSKPLVISPGHCISIHKAVEYVLNCLRKHRLPEPTRQAHLLANHYRREQMLKD